MKKLLINKPALIGLLLIFSGIIVWQLPGEDKIDYNSDVKPILNKHCIACHGGVKQSGGFSLLFEEEAKGNTHSETPAIIPGHPEESEMIRRLLSDDPEERMPYEKEPLSKKEIEILKNWIEQGALWDTHWAYEPVQEVPADDVLNGDAAYETWANNDLDFFVYKKMKELKLTPSGAANTSDLARRLSFDLIGLPPPNALFQEINKRPSEESFNRYIDELLRSMHFGEKWAGMWMDMARYSDTKGYERDDSRTIWKYRDWLIKAFNEDKPYNQFLLEQIAGDMLPDPTDEQLLATAFHRNTMTNDEGGTDNEEFRVAAVIDRVNTTWEVTMGTTFACVQCHGHPYEPIRHEDYYRFMAFFNNSRDEDTYDDYPVFRHFVDEDSIKLEKLKSWLNENTEKQRAKEITRFVKTWQPSINSLTSDKFVNSELSDTKWLVFRNNGSSRLKQVSLEGKNRLIYRYRSFLPGGIWQIRLDSLNGTLVKSIKVKDTKRSWTIDALPLAEIGGTHDIYFTYSNPNLSNPYSNGLLFDWFFFTEEFPASNAKGHQNAKDIFWQLVRKNTLQTPIMMENPEYMARKTSVFERGNWMAKGDLVQPGLPEVFDTTKETIHPNRLGLANWMTSTQNPLTARTYVNRVWQQLFGMGIVETLEDFGSQGIAPTHRDLLDHLSWKFMHDFNWSTKALLKYIVSSATYQQTSYSNPDHLRIDPRNKYMARGPRIRLTAEQIRDQALVVSGLFSSKMNGPSVMPYQPEGIWNSPYNGRKWIQSQGENQYRRALYTYWKRTSPYPTMELFDVMAREVCTSRRIATNTPLQALVTLNDSVYVEAAIHFAQRMLDEGGDEIEDQLKYGYRLMMYKDIPADKLAILMDLYHKIHEPQQQVKQVVQRPGSSLANRHLEAMSIVANTMMNLDEFIMKN